MSAEPSLRLAKKLVNKKIRTTQSKFKNLTLANFLSNKLNISKYTKSLESQIGLFIIVGFSLVMNLSIASAKNLDDNYSAGTLNGLSPETIAQTATDLNKYTPNIDEETNKITYAMATQSDINFIRATDEFATNITPPDPEPVPVARTKTVNYIVVAGDTLSQVAAKFGLTVATLKYTNDLSNSDSLKIGQTLKIPANNLSNNAIAKLQNQQKNKTLASNRGIIGRDSSESSGRFIVPVSHNGISRGITSYHGGIDYMCSVGTSVRASAGGVIVEASSSGWNYGWGKTVLISHGNGVTTRYGHLSQVNVSVGERVAQGEIIGRSGNTGRSTGPHLHFQKDVYGRHVYPF